MSDIPYADMPIIRAISSITGLIRSDAPLEDKFMQALGLIRDVVAFDAASLFVYDEQAGQLEEAATWGGKVEMIESTAFEMGSGLSAWVAKQRDSVLIPEMRKSRPDGFRSFISTPLISGDMLVGVLNLGHRDPGFFTGRQVAFLEIVAAELALLIDRSRFESELVEANRRLTDAREKIERQHRQLMDMERYQLFVQMTASINHEINNPLTTILGNIELLFLKYPGLDKDLHDKLILIQSESRRISAIVEKLRDAKRVVSKEYLGQTGESMIDIDRSL